MRLSLFYILLALSPLLALAQTPPVPTVTLSWTAVTTMNDGTPVPTGQSVSYNIYGGHTATGPWTLAANVLTSGSIRPGVELGSDCYYITSLVNSVESLPTTPICLTVTEAAATVPSTPTGVTAKQTQ
jgi:hypothetical protein